MDHGQRSTEHNTPTIAKVLDDGVSVVKFLSRQQRIFSMGSIVVLKEGERTGRREREQRSVIKMKQEDKQALTDLSKIRTVVSGFCKTEQSHIVHL